jgi:hypothetical protein
LKNHRYGIFDADRPGVEDIQLSDLGVPADPMEVPAENAPHQGQQKDDTEVTAKGNSAKGIQKDDQEAPMKNVGQDLQGAPSLHSQKHSKAATSLGAFMVIHILH